MRSVHHNGFINQTDAFHINDSDESGDPKYYGYSAEDGSFYILEITGGSQFRYCYGFSGYSDAWTGRASLTYEYYHNVKWHSGYR